MVLRIKKLRVERGLTQQELADMAGVSRSQLSEIENKRKAVNTLRLGSIASALGVGVDQLFEPTATEPYQARIGELMKSMAAEDREALIRIAEAMAHKAQIGGLMESMAAEDREALIRFAEAMAHKAKGT